MRHSPQLGIVMAVLLLSGCATMTRGTTEKMVIQSDPPGATATITGGAKMECTTPCNIILKRKADYFIVITMVGYDASYTNLEAHVDTKGRASAVGNVLAGGIVGMGVDTMTGAARVHTPNPLIVKLAPKIPEEHSVGPTGAEKPSARVETSSVSGLDSKPGVSND